MPSLARSALFVSMGTTVLWLCLASVSRGQQVWSGFTLTFNHPANSSAADTITPNVSLTRGNLRGLYNLAYESDYVDDYSPEFTAWATEVNNPEATIEATNYNNLNFTDWRTAFGGGSQLATNIISTNAVVYLTVDDVYLDLRFTSWGIGFGGGGQFTYERAEPPTSIPTGDYNGDHIVDAADYTIWRDTYGQTVANLGDGADGDLSGMIDDGDYQFWKDHFGENVPGSGAAAIAVPEPTVVASLLFGGLSLPAARRRFTPRGPGQIF